MVRKTPATLGSGLGQQDEKLLATVAGRNITGADMGLEYAGHPLRGFLERGLLATINTDSPVVSGIDLRYEYEVAAPAAGLAAAQAGQSQRNALAIAFLSDEERAAVAEKSG